MSYKHPPEILRVHVRARKQEHWITVSLTVHLIFMISLLLLTYSESPFLRSGKPTTSDKCSDWLVPFGRVLNDVKKSSLGRGVSNRHSVWVKKLYVTTNSVHITHSSVLRPRTHPVNTSSDGRCVSNANSVAVTRPYVRGTGVHLRLLLVHNRCYHCLTSTSVNKNVGKFTQERNISESSGKNYLRNIYYSSLQVVHYSSSDCSNNRP